MFEISSNFTFQQINNESHQDEKWGECEISNIKYESGVITKTFAHHLPEFCYVFVTGYDITGGG